MKDKIHISLQTFLFFLFCFTFNLTVKAQAGINCANPVQINTLPYTNSNATTCGFGDDYSSSECGDNNHISGEEVVYEYTPSSSGLIDVSVFNSDPAGLELGVFILDACPGAGGNCIATAAEDPWGAEAKVVGANLAAGETYYIVVSTNDFVNNCAGYEIIIKESDAGVSCEGPVVINSLPYNDLNATTCGFGDDYSSSNCGDNQHIDGEDLVFAYTPSVSGPIDVSVKNSNPANLELGVYILDGCPDGGGNCIAASAEDPWGSPANVSGASLTAGQTYYIIISSDDWTADCGGFELNIKDSDPGVSCAKPYDIPSLPFDENDLTTCNMGMDYDDNDPCLNGNGDFDGPDMVFTYTPSSDQCVIIDLFNHECYDCGGGSRVDDMGLAVMTACPDDPSATCVFTTSGRAAQISTDLSLTANQTYYILVSSEDDDPLNCNNFDLKIKECPPPTSCAAPNEIPSLPFTDNELTTCGQKNDYGLGTACFDNENFGGKDYILRYTSPIDQCVQVKIAYYPEEHRDYRAGIALLTDCPENTTECIDYRVNGQDKGAPGDSFNVAMNHLELKAGETYYIVVASGAVPPAGGDDCNPFTITVREHNCPLPKLTEDPDAISCGQNVDFEQGDLSNWDGNWYNSPRTSSITLTMAKTDMEPYQNGEFMSNNAGLSHGVGSVNGDLGVCPGGINPPEAGTRHTLTTGPGTDPNTDGVVSVVAPNGGANSVRLGNAEPGWGAECMWTTFTVTPDNALFTFMYAVVLQDPPGHIHPNKPRFEVALYDAQGDPVVDCGGKYEVVSVDAVNQFDLARNACGSSIWYQDWKEVNNNLTRYIGQDITVRFCTADCGLGGHFGYAYFDTYCKKVEPTIQHTCIIEGTPATLSAPGGGSNYRWYQGNISDSIQVGTGTNLNVPDPANGDYYTVQYLTADGCNLETVIDSLNTIELVTLTGGDTAICASASGTVNYTISGTPPDSSVISWTSSPAGFNSSELTPVIPMPGQATTYTLRIDQPNQACSYVHSFAVDINPRPTANFDTSSICSAVGITYQFTDSSSGGVVGRQWDFGDGNNSTQQNPAHEYTDTGQYNVRLIVTNNSGCPDTIIKPVNVAYPVLDPDFNYTQDCSDSIIFTNNSSGNIVNWKWDFGGGATSTQQNPVHQFSGPGNYNVKLVVTNSKGCEDSIIKPVQVVDYTIAASATNARCGINDGTAKVTASGGYPPFGYTWSNGATTDSISGLAPNDYYVTVTDSRGCPETDTVTVIVPDGPSASYVQENILCNGGNTGLINLTATGGAQPYNYNWSNNATTEDLSGLTAGTYSVTLTDANNCSLARTITITDQPPLVLNLTPVHNPCFGDAGGALNLQVSGGTPGYVYNWSNGAMIEDPTGLTSGNYSVTVTDTNGCSDTISAVINEPSPLSITANGTNASCTANDGSATVSANGGTSPYNYQWSNNETTASISGLGSGTFYVTVSDSNQCTAVDSVIITRPGGFNVDIEPTDVLCNGGAQGTVNLISTGGSGIFTYNWSNGSTTEDLGSLTAGTYSVTVTDNNTGCIETISAVVNEPSQLTISTNSNNASCSDDDGTATVSANGGTTPYTYQWSNNDTTAQISGLSAGTYYVTVSDSNQCTAVDSVVISKPEPFTLDISPTDALCNGGAEGAINLIPTGGSGNFTYNWSNGSTTEDLGSLSAGTYSVTVSDDITGCSGTISAVINEPAPVSVTTNSTNASCSDNDGTATVTATGGTVPYTYEWSNNNTTASISGLSTGTYYVTVSDSNQCTAVDSVQISRPGSFTLNIDPTDVLCNGETQGAINLISTGGSGSFTYRWSNGSTTEDLGSLTAGTYSVTVTDNNTGCIETILANISEPGPLSVIPDPADASCGVANGSIGVTVSGGTAPYTYNWSNGTTDPSISGLSGGTYAVTLTDNNGCMATTQATISGSAGVTGDFTFSTECGVFNVEFADNSGSSVANWYWDFGDGNNSAEQNPSHSFSGAGTYMVTLVVTDVSGNCSDTVSNLLILNEGPTALFNFTAECNTTVIEFKDSSISGSAPITSWYWDFGNGRYSNEQNPVHDFSGSGNYNVKLVVTDSNGCTDSISNSVDIGPLCEYEVWFPNAFTPEITDKDNHRARVRGKGIAEIEVRIFDRWGELVYHTKDVEEALGDGWDGTFEGQFVDMDSYAYYIIAKTSCCGIIDDEELFIKGSLTVLR